jgi:hypothetical protein
MNAVRRRWCGARAFRRLGDPFMVKYRHGTVLVVGGQAEGVDTATAELFLLATT